mgnify:CR=1 FL=1
MKDQDELEILKALREEWESETNALFEKQGKKRKKQMNQKKFLRFAKH